MSGSQKITTTYNNTKYQMVFNTTILLLTKDEPINIEIDNNELKLKILVEFINDDDVKEFNTNFTTKDGLLTLKHNKFYADAAIGNALPLRLNLDDNKSHVIVKYSSNANHSQDKRKYEITIWKSI